MYQLDLISFFDKEIFTRKFLYYSKHRTRNRENQNEDQLVNEYLEAQDFLKEIITESHPPRIKIKKVN
jgi:hypothetical protein